MPAWAAGGRTCHRPAAWGTVPEKPTAYCSADHCRPQRRLSPVGRPDQTAVGGPHPTRTITAMHLIEYYLLAGLIVHIAFLGLVDWLGYNHLVQHGYHPTLLVLAALNVAILIGLYYLVLRPLQQRIARRRLARDIARQRSQP